MNNKYFLLLCEGETDKILISYYLNKLSGWKYFTSNETPFTDHEEMSWYSRNTDILGIWPVGGNSFNSTIIEIAEYESYQHSIDKIIIVTDHDSNDEVEKRHNDIYNAICNSFKLNDLDICYFLSNKNQWISIDVVDSFNDTNKIQFCYLLVPDNCQGALENCVLDYLSDNDCDKQKVIKEVKKFIANFDSNVFLKTRRDKIKAELGISFSIFSPDKIFTTMNELLKSIDYCKFDLINSQFSIFKNL